MGELTQNKLKELLYYDPLTGVFTWLERPVSMFKLGKYQLRAFSVWNSKLSDKEAGCKHKSKKDKTSYIEIGITLNEKKKNYKAHRLVFLYLDGEFPPEFVDHIDGNGLNNKRDNLREVSHQENHKNRSTNINNTSGHIGVHWRKDCQKYLAYVHVDGKKIRGGLFVSIKDAIEKRKAMEVQYGFHKNHGRKNGRKY